MFQRRQWSLKRTPLVFITRDDAPSDQPQRILLRGFRWIAGQTPDSGNTGNLHPLSKMPLEPPSLEEWLLRAVIAVRMVRTKQQRRNSMAMAVNAISK